MVSSLPKRPRAEGKIITHGKRNVYMYTWAAAASGPAGGMNLTEESDFFLFFCFNDEVLHKAEHETKKEVRT